MSYDLSHIANLVDGTIEGDDLSIAGVATLDDATRGDISFFHNTRYRQSLKQTNAAAVLIKKEHVADCDVTALIVDDPYLAYARIAALFDKAPKTKPGIHPSAVIATSAKLDETVSIGPHVVIGEDVELAANVVIDAGCVIGDRVKIAEQTRLMPRVTLYHDVVIGARCRIHSGTVIGADGFGYAPSAEGWQRIPQLGTVVVEDDVDIGANTTIDRGALGDTVIEQGAIIDNQIQIGHNARIGARTALAGCVGISGSTTIGKNCQIGGGAGIAGHLSITDNVIIGALSGVRGSIDKPGIYSCSLSVQDEAQWRRNVARLRKLDMYVKRLKRVENQLSESTPHQE